MMQFIRSLFNGDWWLSRFGQWLCERRGHDEPVWFNFGGSEPDMHCKRCGKDMK